MKSANIMNDTKLRRAPIAEARRAVRDVTPSASRLTTSLRDIGYDPHTAIADLVDNAIDAGATRINVRVEFAGAASRIIVSDNGSGMTRAELDEALRFGSRRPYASADLGRFGLGLKTASLALGRRLTVLTRSERNGSATCTRTLCLDHIDRFDRWEVLARVATRNEQKELDAIGRAHGTTIVIESLDRLLNESHPESGWTRRRLSTVSERTKAHLGMVFHRFIDGSVGRVQMRVNDSVVQPWNPFAPGEACTIALAVQEIHLETRDGNGLVRFSPYVLPPRNLFSSQEAFETLSGPRKWNRQQGLYIYRANRMIQSGGWCGLRAADEHTKLARAALDFPTGLDELFGVNVAKMRASLPPQLRQLLEQPILGLSQRADAAYRSTRTGTPPSQPQSRNGAEPGARSSLRTASLCISVAAHQVGEFEALTRIMKQVAKTEPALAREMGW